MRRAHRAILLRAPQVFGRHVGSAVSQAAIEIGREARRRAPKAFSTLTQSIRSRQVSPLEGQVVAGVQYARLVEEDARPGGRPPVRSLLDWIKVRNIQPDDPTMSQEDLAFVMARSIAKRGTPAQPYLKPALEFQRARAEQLINAAIDKSLKEMGG